MIFAAQIVSKSISRYSTILQHRGEDVNIGLGRIKASLEKVLMGVVDEGNRHRCCSVGCLELCDVVWMYGLII